MGELVEPKMMRRNIERPNRLANGQSMEVRHDILDQETPARFEVRSCVAKASNLLLLGAEGSRSC